MYLLKFYFTNFKSISNKLNKMPLKVNSDSLFSFSFRPLKLLFFLNTTLMLLWFLFLMFFAEAAFGVAASASHVIDYIIDVDGYAYATRDYVYALISCDKWDIQTWVQRRTQNVHVY